MEYRSSTKIIQMTDTLKIPRVTIQYSNQQESPHRRDNIGRMNKLLVKSKTVDSLPTEGNNFETFFNDLEHNEPDDISPRSSTISGKNLTAANLARLNRMNTTIAPIMQPITSPMAREYTITVDSMTTTTNQKTKEPDSASNASSTHFTMVNGFGGSRIRQQTKSACCCNHITAVIVSMTILFMFIIFGVIIFAEYPRMMAEIEQ